MSERKDLTKKTQYNIQYAKEKIKRVPLDMQLSDYEELKAAAAAMGEGVNTYIKRAVKERMEREATAQIGGSPPQQDVAQVPQDDKQVRETMPAWAQKNILK